MVDAVRRPRLSKAQINAIAQLNDRWASASEMSAAISTLGALVKMGLADKREVSGEFYFRKSRGAPSADSFVPRAQAVLVRELCKRKVAWMNRQLRMSKSENRVSEPSVRDDEIEVLLMSGRTPAQVVSEIMKASQ